MPKRILLIDDNVHLLDTAADILEDAGYVVSIAGSCHTAMEILRAKPFDVLIVDFNLPDGKGSDLAPMVQQLRPGTRFILMTGEANVDLRISRPGVHDVLTKPVDPQRLLKILSK